MATRTLLEINSHLRSFGRLTRGADGDSGPDSNHNWTQAGNNILDDVRQSVTKQSNASNKASIEFKEALSGHGSALWDRVAETASKLTINVSQAWQKSIHDDDDDAEREIAQGEDTRLTKAMKAYHLSRARTPADLPAWLFTERERGIGNLSWKEPAREAYEDQFRPGTNPIPAQRTGLREVYDRINVSEATSSLQPHNPRVGSSQAVNRLRAIRETKRAAVTAPSVSASGSQPPDTRGNVRRGLPVGPKDLLSAHR